MTVARFKSSRVANLPARASTGSVVVVGLGPSDADLLTVRAMEAIRSVPPERRYCRTVQHPAAKQLIESGIEFNAFDSVYEGADAIDEVYEQIAKTLVGASASGEVVYAVPGSPAIGETAVSHLQRAAERGEIHLEIVPGVSFVEAVAVAVGSDPMTDALQVIDAERIAEQPIGEGPLLVAQCHNRLVVSDVKLELLETLGPEHKVAVVSDASGPNQLVEWCPLAEIDTSERDYSSRTSIFVPAHPSPVGGTLRAFVDLVEVLRGPGGCPWDARQTHHSLTRHLLEETYEVLEAIEGLGPEAPKGEVDLSAYSKLEEELGDLLFQVAFHATLAKEAGAFTISDVARGIHDKLVGRHPHVFGEVEVSGPEEVVRNWEQIKAGEKDRESLMDDIPVVLPALAYALKMQRRAASVGFDWDAVPPVMAKVREELSELEAEIETASDSSASVDIKIELGDVLFAVVNLARRLGVDPEAALRLASEKFAARFRVVETLATERGTALASMSLSELDALWEEAKAALDG